MGKKNNNTITSYDNPPEKIDGDLFYSLQLDKEQGLFILFRLVQKAGWAFYPVM